MSMSRWIRLDERTNLFRTWLLERKNQERKVKFNGGSKGNGKNDDDDKVEKRGKSLLFSIY